MNADLRPSVLCPSPSNNLCSCYINISPSQFYIILWSHISFHTDRRLRERPRSFYIIIQLVTELLLDIRNLNYSADHKYHAQSSISYSSQCLFAFARSYINVPKTVLECAAVTSIWHCESLVADNDRISLCRPWYFLGIIRFEVVVYSWRAVLSTRVYASDDAGIIWRITSITSQLVHVLICIAGCDSRHLHCSSRQ